MVQFLILVVIPATIAGFTVLARSFGRIVQCSAGMLIAAALTLMLFRDWRPGVPLAPFLFSGIFPVGASFLAASPRSLKPAIAFLLAVGALYVGAFCAIYFSFMMGLRP
jgi:hypothetical protein